MDARVEILNKHLKGHDRYLYAIRTGNDMVQVYRQSTRWDSYEVDGKTLTVSRPNPQFIIALTADWTLRSKPVEWGIEPLMWKLKEMDSWRDDRQLEKIRRERETRAELTKRAERNETRAIAADLRRDFARETNDVNTSTLERVDNRRKKDGY